MFSFQELQFYDKYEKDCEEFAGHTFINSLLPRELR
jgi:hypothetical protein